MEDITPEGSGPVYLVQFTEEELATQERIMTEEEARVAAEESKAAARVKAITKLAKLGLTEEEITALIGG
jgi:hypothetical protein